MNAFVNISANVQIAFGLALISFLLVLLLFYKDSHRSSTTAGIKK
jgi:hypothetical protein